MTINLGSKWVMPTVLAYGGSLIFGYSVDHLLSMMGFTLITHGILWASLRVLEDS